ncbi:MAG: NUDIX domain-containing protein, partial [Rhodospirillaceae bacterium]
MIERPSARLILLDPQDRLFMFKVHQPTVYDPADPHYGPFWIAIGGLVDPGEEFAHTAVREAREETGLIVKDVRWIWSRERIMQWRERKVLHRERFFLGRTDSTEIDTSGLDD